MKPTAFWLRHLAVAGSCLVWAGCGGGGVPDPSSDPLAATEGGSQAASQPSAPPEPEPAPAPAPAPVAAAPSPVVAETKPVKQEVTDGFFDVPPKDGDPAPAPVVAETTPAPTPVASTDGVFDVPAKDADPAGATTAEVKGDSSGTDEMLRIGSSSSEISATSPTPGANPDPAGAGPVAAVATPGPALAGAPGPAMGGARGERTGEAEGDLSLRAGGAELPGISKASMPGRVGDETRLPSPTAGIPGGGAMDEGSIMPGGGFGSGGDPSAAGADLGPNSFQNAGVAVNSFLNALKAKNKDQLSQATARRAATEAVEKHRKIFAAILEQSVSDEELDDMAKSLDGYKVMGTLPAKSTGQQGVLIGKMEGLDRFQRTVVVRREKEGWKVMDIGNAIDFKPMGTYRRPFGRR